MNFPNLQEGEWNAGLVMQDNLPQYWLILLPARGEDLTWQRAIDWPKSVGGELPTRMESALLYANLRDKIDPDEWYWTATPYAGAERCAWIQDFHTGGQHYDPKGTNFRAVAVRRVPFEDG